MCGIVGVVGKKRPLNLNALLHRGPDASGVFEDDQVVLGHTRLAIMDLSTAGHQPMQRAHAVVVFNGEIYNHRALRLELQALGHTFTSRSDTEVLVAGYLQWGDAVVARLDGMFAFGLWDLRQRRLLLARDRAGKKPLFYAEHQGSFVFASEVKALPIPLRFDAAQLPFLLALGYAPGSLYKGVHELPPAHVWADGQTRRYWQAPFHLPPTETPHVATVRSLVESAVERRIEADVPVGAFLSGGIDSSVIVGIMARTLGQRVRTFSIGFAGDARYDETHYARLVSKAFATEHTEFTLEPASFDLVERLVDAHDGPFGDASAIPTSVVSMLTREHVKVALTGDGGDELFCGYTRFLAARYADALPVSIRLPARGRDLKGLYARAARFLRVANRPLAERLYAWSGYFIDDLAQILPGADDAPLRWSTAHALGHTPMQRILAHNFHTYLPHDLLVKADRASMMHSLELRSPFLDTALIEYCARLPERALHRGTTTKWILRQAFEHLLPKPILARGKMGFGVPLGTWFRNDLRDSLHDRLAPGAALYAHVNEAYVRKLLHAHDNGHADHGLRLWLLLTLQVWLQRSVTLHAGETKE